MRVYSLPASPKAAGLARPALCLLFPGKAEVFQAVVERMTERMLTSIAESLKDEWSLEERLMAIRPSVRTSGRPACGSALVRLHRQLVVRRPGHLRQAAVLNPNEASPLELLDGRVHALPRESCEFSQLRLRNLQPKRTPV